MKASLIRRGREEQKYLKKIYRELIDKKGWTLNAVDEMDIHYFFELYREDEPTDEVVYIDEIKLF